MPTNTEPLLEIDPARLVKRLLVVCISIELSLVLADLLINYAQLSEQQVIRRFFNLAREDGVGTWFAFMQAFMTSLILLLIYFQLRKKETPRWRLLGWLLLAAFFFYVSFDDSMEFHERFGSAMRRWTDGSDIGSSLFSFWPGPSWQVVFLPVFAALAIFMLVFLHKEFISRWKRLGLAAAIACYAFAVFLDFLEGFQDGDPMSLYWLIQSSWHLERYTVWHLAKVLEEFLEMLGTTFFAATFLAYLTGIDSEILIRFKPEPNKQATG